jgi:hypothetical protein
MLTKSRKLVFQFNQTHFFLSILLFLTEVIIAAYLHDAVIRPYGGDFLVVILIYCFVKSFLNTPVKATALSVLLFSYLIETLQYFHIVNFLGLQNSKIACIVIGTSFAWTDILAYTLGILFVFLIESTLNKKATA